MTMNLEPLAAALSEGRKQAGYCNKIPIPHVRCTLREGHEGPHAIERGGVLRVEWNDDDLWAKSRIGKELHRCVRAMREQAAEKQTTEPAVSQMLTKTADEVDEAWARWDGTKLFELGAISLNDAWAISKEELVEKKLQELSQEDVP